MDQFACFSSVQRSIPSPDGQLVATVTGSCLLIRSCANNAVIQIFESELKSTSQWRFVKWYTQGKNNIGKVRDARVNNKQGGPIWRLLLADDDFVHLYDASGAQSRVKIGNLAGNTGKIADVQFGFTEDQVLVFSDFGFKVTFLTVSKKRGLEFRDPKKNCTCYNYRPGTGHLALLTRPSLHDILLILQPDDSGPVESVELPTIDAQGVLWSPNGQWLVIWDTASAGYKVLIYTADGHLFKTYHGGQDADNIGLGAKTFTWSPSGEFLAIGDFDQRIVLLKCKTFYPVTAFYHQSTVCLPQVPVWQEQINASGQRSYVPVSQPSCPPTGVPNTDDCLGVSTLEFNLDGTLLASKSDATPSTIWIWYPHRGTAAAVLIHHSPVKSIQWHPTITDQLLIHCNVTQTVAHIWKATWETPKVVHFRLNKPGGKMEAAWLGCNAAGLPSLMLGNAHNYAVAQIDHEGELVPITLTGETLALGPEDKFDEDQSASDLQHMRSYDNEAHGDSRQERLNNGASEQWDKFDEVDDTFDYRRHLKAAI